MKDEDLKHLKRLDIPGAVARWRSEVILPGEREGPRPLPAMEGMRNFFGLDYSSSVYYLARPQAHLWRGSPPDTCMAVVSHALRVRLMFNWETTLPHLGMLSELGMQSQFRAPVEKIHDLLRETEMSSAQLTKRMWVVNSNGADLAALRGEIVDLGLALSENVARELCAITGSPLSLIMRGALPLVFSLMPPVKDGVMVGEALPLRLTPIEVGKIFSCQYARSYTVNLTLRMLFKGLTKHHASSVEEIYHLQPVLPMDLPPDIDAATADLSRSEVNALARLLTLTDYNGANDIVVELLNDNLEDNLELLSVPRLVAMAQLVEEYNPEWAIASFDWSR